MESNNPLKYKKEENFLLENCWKIFDVIQDKSALWQGTRLYKISSISTKENETSLKQIVSRRSDT